MPHRFAPALLAPLLVLGTTAHAGVVFEDSFSAGTLSGYSFIDNTAAWNVASGKLQSSATQTAHHPAGPEFAVIDGVATSTHFKIEADVQVVGAEPSHDLNWGHVGFFWGRQSGSDYSAGYLRTHADQLTVWHRQGNGTERLVSAGANLVNAPDLQGVSYHLAYEVDYTSRSVTLSVDGVSGSFTGTDFDAVSRPGNVGGSLGLIGWGERVSFDNVRVTDFTTAVPEPASLALMLAGVVGVGLAARRRR